MSKNHTHVVDREETVGPDYWGSIKVSEYCWCGAYMGFYIDSVL